MSRIIDFTTNADKGFQLSTDVMALLQTELRELIEGLDDRFGDLVVLKGCDDPDLDSTFDPGILFYNDEIYYFEGGVFNDFIVTSTTTTQLRFQDGNDYDAYTVKTLVFAAAVPAGEVGFAVTEDAVNGLVNELNYFDRTLYAMDQQISTNITNIGNCLVNAPTVNADIDAIQNMLFKIGDTMWVKDVSDFTTGIGDNNTIRRNWCVVGSDALATALTALGLDPATTWTQLRQSVLAMAQSSDYGLLVGDNSKTIATANLPVHTHPFSTSMSLSGAHTHTANMDDGVGGGSVRRFADGSIVDDSSGETILGGASDDTIDGVLDHTHGLITGTTDPTGGGIPLNVQQKTVYMYLIVKYQ